ncbi:alpha/beta hydrolase [Glaciihabitans sp. dw_435]|uniref:alpha/beta hydrolase n=1 Tax=Glaciihabitans sp. dw_435 TaxID=2720081 RepID=UPI001BD5BBF2|nr:alpha/beta hydrolase [Glaciihabitans sp. dw_435]
MTIVNPSPFTLGYDVPDPGKGDTAHLRAIATSRTTNAGRVGDAIALISTITGDLPSHWTGYAASMNLNATQALVPDLTVLKASYEKHAEALTTYATEVERIRDAAAPQAAAYTSASDDIVGWRSQRDYIEVGYPTPREYTPIIGAPPGLYEEADWERAVALDGYIDEAEATMATAKAALEALVADRAAADKTCADALSSSEARGPFSTVESSDGLSQKEILDLLDGMSPTEATLYLNSHPDLLNALADGNPDNADAIAKLWTSLGAGGTEVAKDHPDVVGNLEGASSFDRGIANKIVLDRELASAQRGLDSATTPADKERFRTRLETLNNIVDSLGAGMTAKPPRSLHSLDTSGQVLASVVYGDLDNADHASYNVPGMNTNVHDSMTNWGKDSKRFYDEQVNLLIADGMDAAEAQKQVAVVSWIGYDTPNPLTVGSPIQAIIGAEKLQASIEGTTAQRDIHNPSGTLGVVAHSYGSTTAMAALSKDMDVDTLVTYGSAGEIIGSHPELNDGWYQTESPDDPWAKIGQITGGRPSPALDPSSQSLDSQSGYWENPSTHKLEYVESAHTHSGYMVKDTASLHNMAAVTIGKPELISTPVGPALAPGPLGSSPNDGAL